MTKQAHTSAAPITRCSECGGPLHERRDGELICVWRMCPAYDAPVEDDPEAEQ